MLVVDFPLYVHFFSFFFSTAVLLLLDQKALMLPSTFNLILAGGASRLLYCFHSKVQNAKTHDIAGQPDRPHLPDLKRETSSTLSRISSSHSSIEQTQAVVLHCVIDEYHEYQASCSSLTSLISHRRRSHLFYHLLLLFLNIYFAFFFFSSSLKRKL
jgi:hypothetical protein